MKYLSRRSADHQRADLCHYFLDGLIVHGLIKEINTQKDRRGVEGVLLWFRVFLVRVRKDPRNHTNQKEIRVIRGSFFSSQASREMRDESDDTKQKGEGTAFTFDF